MFAREFIKGYTLIHHYCGIYHYCPGWNCTSSCVIVGAFTAGVAGTALITTGFPL